METRRFLRHLTEARRRYSAPVDPDSEPVEPPAVPPAPDANDEERQSPKDED